MKENRARIIFATVVILIVVVLLVSGGLYLYRLSSYKSIVANAVVATPDLALCEDGQYEGSFDAIIVAATVKVTLKDHQITAIEILEHKTDRGHKAEPITELVIATQSLEVDTVSGATNSSTVILMAIQDALEQAQGR